MIMGAPPPAPAIAVSVCILGKILPEPEGTNNSGPCSPTRIGVPFPTGPPVAFFSTSSPPKPNHPITFFPASPNAPRDSAIIALISKLNNSLSQITSLSSKVTIISPILKFLAFATFLASSPNPNSPNNHSVTERSASFIKLGKNVNTLNADASISEELSNLNILPNHSLIPVITFLTVFTTKLSSSSSEAAQEKSPVTHPLTLSITSPINFDIDQPPSSVAPASAPHANKPLNQSTTVLNASIINVENLKGSSGSPHPKRSFKKFIAKLSGNIRISTRDLTIPEKLVSLNENNSVTKSIALNTASLILPTRLKSPTATAAESKPKSSSNQTIAL